MHVGMSVYQAIHRLCTWESAYARPYTGYAGGNECIPRHTQVMQVGMSVYQAIHRLCIMHVVMTRVQRTEKAMDPVQVILSAMVIGKLSSSHTKYTDMAGGIALTVASAVSASL